MECDEKLRMGRTKLSPNQFGLMVDFMSLNPILVGGKFSEKCDKAELHEKWEELAVLLNADKTGCRKTTERWRKSWTDMKMQIKNKVTKVNSNRPYMVRLNEVENKAWKLICSSRKYDSSDTSKSNDNISKSKSNHVDYSQALEGTKFILVNFDDMSEIKPSEISPVNNLLDENDKSSSQVEDVLEKSTSKSISDESLDECNKLSEMNSEESMDPETKHINGEKVASNHENDVVIIEPTARKSSNYFSKKRFRSISHKLWKERKQEETSIIQLLKKQNELLEYIAGSIGRVEKAVVTNLSQQSKKNEIKTVHDNIDKIAECFGSVSTSLKKIVQK